MLKELEQKRCEGGGGKGKGAESHCQSRRDVSGRGGKEMKGDI